MTYRDAIVLYVTIFILGRQECVARRDAQGERVGKGRARILATIDTARTIQQQTSQFVNAVVWFTVDTLQAWMGIVFISVRSVNWAWKEEESNLKVEHLTLVQNLLKWFLRRLDIIDVLVNNVRVQAIPGPIVDDGSKGQEPAGVTLWPQISGPANVKVKIILYFRQAIEQDGNVIFFACLVRAIWHGERNIGAVPFSGTAITRH